ncbi:MAG: DUF5012 domain-containing protein [Muribaculaceae bacterium]|nr:DUF5012 domain-containing protein [Muribaculaceae bacterium]
MKKLYIFAMTLFMATMGIAFTSCNDDKDQLTDSRLTYYVVLEMQGDDFIAIPKGSKFVDPGCKATLGGEDAADRIVTEGEVDVNTVGFYPIVYSAANDDGFDISASRTVCVYDPNVTIDMSGVYDADMEASIYLNNGKTYADRAAFYGKTNQVSGITFEEVVPGIFYCDDLFGGWYAQIRGYGWGYAMTGYISVDNDGNVELLDSYTPTWGDSLDYFADGAKYDVQTKTISYKLSYAGQIYMAPVLVWVSPLPEEE